MEDATEAREEAREEAAESGEEASRYAPPQPCTRAARSRPPGRAEERGRASLKAENRHRQQGQRQAGDPQVAPEKSGRRRRRATASSTSRRLGMALSVPCE